MQIAMKRSKSGFTLIELLVVVTIIGILAGLSVPALKTALNGAKKAQAGTMVNNLKVALTAYQSDYGNWPTFMSSSTIRSYGGSGGPQLYNMLIGSASGTDNPRQTVYMEFTKKDVCDASGNPVATVASAVGFADPWKQTYYIVVDGSYANQLTVPNKNSSGGEIINASIAIWSQGIPSSGSSNSGYITSW